MVKRGIKLPEGITADTLQTSSSLSSYAIVELKKSGLRGRANIYAKEPCFFRIEVLGPFDKMVSLIVSDCEGFSVYDGKDFKYYDLNAVPYPITFHVEEVVSVLTGRSVRGDLSAFEKNGYEISFDKDGFLSEVKRDKTVRGANSLTAEIKDYKYMDGFAVPHSISLDFTGDELKIFYRDVEVNPELAENIFTHPLN